ncbi:MAG: SCO family protein [Acidimicrobiales bacterium]
MSTDIDQAHSQRGHPARSRAPETGRARLFLAIAVVGAVVILAGAVLLLVRQHQSQATLNEIRPSGIPASVSTTTANLMGLSPVPHKAAPGFVLTDQHDVQRSLASFRGRAVVLEFMDPHCVDICPLVSEEFVDAYHDLGRAARKVVFMAVNVNAFHPSVADVMTFSREHELVTIPSWHFFTGPVQRLQAVWREYNIQVQAPSPNADIIHTSIVYFIDPSGTERFVASPMVDHTKAGKAYLPLDQLAAWGRGIALVAEHIAS